MKAYERLLNYVKVYTTSQEGTGCTPTTARQKDLGRMLVEEMKEIGIADAEMDELGYVYASIPATEGMEDKPAIGWIAHMDTAPGFSGENVNPIIHENYNGEDVVLGSSGLVIKTDEFPFMKDLKGRTLITADGTTLLGADDKAGIAEILTACETLLHSDAPHGAVKIAFTPDEEVGEGADHFDVKRFGADYAYTMDGGETGGISYENFNAASAHFDVKGVSVHPGSAKDIMVNALKLVAEMDAMLPASDVPEHTDGYEGFFMLESISGDPAKAQSDYIVRDHDRARFEERKAQLERIAAFVSAKYPTAKVELTIRDSYYNMLEKITPCMHLIDNAKKACEQAGVEWYVEATRGGTDGARLSYMGLPCPNLGTGGYNFHGPYECITTESMDKAVEVILNIIALYTK